MCRKLEAVGLRPISALVDITNWLTLDIGRPAHIYDARKVSGPIGARLARPDESFEALNGKVYETDEEMTVIFDSSGMLGLGGVIGGAGTGADDDDKRGLSRDRPLRSATHGGHRPQAQPGERCSPALRTGYRRRFCRPRCMEIATRLILDDLRRRGKPRGDRRFGSGGPPGDGRAPVAGPFAGRHRHTGGAAPRPYSATSALWFARRVRTPGPSPCRHGAMTWSANRTSSKRSCEFTDSTRSQ